MASLVPESVLDVKRLRGMTAQPLLYIAIVAVALMVMFKTLYWRFIDITTGTADILMERWLSFAEVKHAVILYFGSRKV